MAKDTKIKTQTVEREPIPQDGGYGWVILAACFMISFIIDGAMYSFGLFIGDIQKHFDITRKDANLLTSLYTGFLFLSGPIVAGLTNAFGIRAIVVAGAAVTGSCFIVCVFSPNIFVMYGLFGIIGGVASGCLYLGSLIIVSQYFDKKMGIALGVTMSGSGVGSFAIAQIIKILLVKYDWKIGVIVCGGLILLCCFLGAFLRPCPTRLVSKNTDATDTDKPQIKEPEKNTESANLSRRGSTLGKSTTSVSIFQSKNNLTNNMPVYISNEPSTKKHNITSFAGSMVSVGNFNQTLNMKTLQEEFIDQPQSQRLGQIALQILRDVTNVKLFVQNSEFFFATLCNFFCFCGLFIPYIYIPVHAEKYIGKEKAADILGLIGIVNIPMRLGFGWIADRKIISAMNLNIIAIAIVSSSLWFIGFLTTYWQQMAFGLIFATGTAGTNVLVNPYVTDIVGQAKFNNALGIVNLFRGAACFLGPYIGGFVAEKSGNYLAAFYFSALCFSLAGVSSILCSSIGTLKALCKKKTKATEDEIDPLKSSKA